MHFFDWPTRLHHDSSSHDVKWVSDSSGSECDYLRVKPLDEDSLVSEEHGLAGIVETKVEGTIGNDTDDAEAKASVESSWPIFAVDGAEAVLKPSKLSGTPATDV